MSIVVAGWLAALLVFATFFMKTMIPLRVVAIASNIAFMAYALLGLEFGVFGRLYPILVLHATLLPLNLVRLRQITTLTRAVREASDETAVRALIPFMRTETRHQGDILFAKGDAADKLYVLQEGTVLFPEIGKRISGGAVFGEVGLFAPQHRRALTAVCDDDCQLSRISRDRVLELYYQNPEFGFFLIRLVSDLVIENRERASVPSPLSSSA
jgi:CRP/FNR family transcriptional regulator, cyclic AMP receptor protein